MAFTLIGFITSVSAQSNVRATKHNLSSTGTGSVKATTETQVCVFCHTPHGANSSAKTPLWNRSGTTSRTYTPYSSSSLNATTGMDALNGTTSGSSMLCLSCHDGVIALGNVNVLAGQANPTIAGLTGTMPVGSGVNTGFTRNLGTDLSNDHPISITYNDALATADGEMTRLSTTDPKQQNTAASGTAGKLIGIRSSGYKPLLPLEPTGTNNAGQVQCATCHDPHITKEKFLRLNRFQTTAAPSGTTFSEANDQICLACHPKLGATWAQSAHANTTSAAYVYKDDASGVRGFPTGGSAKKVWEVGCLNCHDTHTASGSRRLLREGTGTTPSATSAAFQAGSTTRPLENVSAIENTCYQCHNTPNSVGGADTVGATILKGTTLTASTGVPDIFTEFARAVHMPIKTSDQNDVATAPANTNTNITEIHDITDSNFTESQLKLGRGNTMNRHVECTDCHNPHRVIKNSLLTGGGSATQRTHTAGGATGNIASGVLRGAWGVEPVFAALGNPWPQAPSSFTVKKGDPGSSVATDSGQAYLTREYQLCFKCHSNYANGDTAASFPLLGNTSGGTLSGTNGMTRYTNVAAEFGSVNATASATTGTDQAEYGESSVATEDSTGLEPAGSYPADTDPGTAMTDIAGTQNHRSWHPVMWPTGRTLDERRISGTASYNFRTPFAANVGTQTMHCSDCHGQSTSWTQDTGPKLTEVQGPHGSSNNFLLKGTWSTSTTISSTGICGNCHAPSAASCDTGNCAGDGLSGSQPSGFNNYGTNSQGGHGNAHSGKACMRCHIAVPHGWKNKAFLVNLNCVGSEGGQASECVTVNNVAGLGSNSASFTSAPYYQSSWLRVAVWRASGNWSETSCGLAAGGLKGPGKDWMTDGGSC